MVDRVSVPSIPAIGNDVPIGARRSMIAMKDAIEYLLRQQRGTTTSTSASSSGSGQSAHNNLPGLNEGDFIHLTAADFAGLTAGADTGLHFHAADRDLANATGQLAWSSINLEGSDITQLGGALVHARLGELQGGSTGIEGDQFYHLTQVEHDGLVNGETTVLHTHSLTRLTDLDQDVLTQYALTTGPSRFIVNFDGNIDEGGALVYQGGLWVAGPNFSLSAVQKTGIETDATGAYTSTLTFNMTTRTMTIAPKVIGGSFSAYVQGKRYTFTNSQTLSIDSAFPTPATGGYFFYFELDGVLKVTNTPWSLIHDAPVMYVYYDATTGRAIPFDERHHAGRDVYWHQNQHLLEGTKAGAGFAATGYTLADGTSDAAVTYAIDTGRVSDEDIDVDTVALPDGGPYTLLRRTSTGAWTISTGNTLPFFHSASTIEYNYFDGANWTLAAVPDERWVNYWVFALTALPATSITGWPGGSTQYIMIPGQAIYTSEILAHAESAASLSWGALPFQELAPLYQVTFRSNTSAAGGGGPVYTNTARCALTRIVRVVGNASIITSAVQTDHGSLAGTADDDHLQYTLNVQGAGKTRVTFDATTATLAASQAMLWDVASSTFLNKTILDDYISVGTYDKFLTGLSAATLDVALERIDEKAVEWLGDTRVKITANTPLYDKQPLAWDSVSGTFKNTVIVLDDVSDVNAASPEDYEALVRVSGAWVDGDPRFAAGTVGAPSITFRADTNTGIWNPAADTIGFSTGGTERVRVGSSGNTQFTGTAYSTYVIGFNVSGAGERYYQSYDSAAPLDSKYWRWGPDGTGKLSFQLLNDAYNFILSRPLVLENGQAQFASGTVGVPSLSATGDTNTGIYFPAADTIGISTGGTERLRIDTDVYAIAAGVKISAGRIIKSDADTGVVSMYGGNVTGANIELYGGSHATLANLMVLDADTIYIRAAAGTGERARFTSSGLSTGMQITSTVATGTAPLVVASTTAVANLNADLLDGNHASAFAAAAHTHSSYNLAIAPLTGAEVFSDFDISNGIVFGTTTRTLTAADIGAATSGHNHSGVYEPVITAGTSSQFWKGDKTWATIVNGDIPAALTGKTYNGLTLTANATGFTVAGGTSSKSLIVPINLTVAGSDSTLNLGNSVVNAAFNADLLDGYHAAAANGTGTNVIPVGTFAALASGQAITWNGSTWVNGSVNVAGGLAGQVYVSNGTVGGWSTTVAPPTAGAGTSIAGLASTGTGISGVATSSGTGVYGSAVSGFGVRGICTGAGGYAGIFESSSTNGTGVYGSGSSYGAYGTSAGYGVLGNSTSATLAGVHGQNSAGGPGVYGFSGATNGFGVSGSATQTGGRGVYGSGVAYGTFGTTSSTTGVGAYGEASATTGTPIGVQGAADGGSVGIGVWGRGTLYGVQAVPNGASAHGFYADHVTASATGSAVYGRITGASATGNGVYGYTDKSGAKGVKGENTAAGTGVYGSSAGGKGVEAVNTVAGGYGVHATSNVTGGAAVYGTSSGSYGGSFHTTANDGTALWVTSAKAGVAIRASATGANDSAVVNGIGVWASGAYAIYADSLVYFDAGSYTAGSATVGGAITANSGAASIGFGAGAGSSVTQTTSRTTGVTINYSCGKITLVSAANSGSWQSFTVTNNKVAATDTIIVNQSAGTDIQAFIVTNVAAGSFKISFASLGGTTTESPAVNFAVIKAVT